MHVRSRPDGTGRRWLSVPLLLLLVMATALVAVPGCGGCFGDGTTADAKKKKEEDEKKEKEQRRKKAEKPKPDFEPLLIRQLPSNDPTQSERNPPIRVKPGHWIAVNEITKANNFDFPGELATYCEAGATNVPLEVEGTTARLSNWRPAILPKGQTKTFEAMFFVPRRTQGENLSSVYSLRSELRGMRGGRTEEYATSISRALKPYEHLIVVLASNPAAYAHFDKLNTVRMPAVEASTEDTLRHYYVVRPNVERRAPLPSYPLAWTTIAYVVWDDMNPDVLTAEQQQALIDWLHWGGQLVISGPTSLDKLKGTYLAPYLPGEVAQTVKLEQAAFDELNATYSLERDPAKVKAEGAKARGVALRKIEVSTERPMVAVELKKHPEAREMEGTGGLVVERRVGGGRIVVTRFPLNDVRVKQWRNFDGFFNAVLLRRPARVFSSDQFNGLRMAWSESALSAMLLEARLGSTVRYFSRDIGQLGDAGSSPVASGGSSAGMMTGAAPADVSATPAMPQAAMAMGGMYGYDPMQPVHADTSTSQPDIDDWRFCGYQATRLGGVAAWNDHGAASVAAKQALTAAAGIEIPEADFVMKVLAVYLLVLVPLNWLLFWFIGRLEWAWIAAPIIAVVGAGAVIRLAQLDIGFARSRTEIAILEAQGDYDRAHLTRYTALYTSLSSNYTVAFEDPSALALPFSQTKADASPFSIQRFTDVLFRRDKETSLAGLQVASNSTGMVHSEQMLPLGGKLTLLGDAQKGFTLKNTSDVTIQDVGVFRRADDSPAIQTAFVAKIEPDTTVPLRFEPLAGEKPWLPEWDKTGVFAPEGSAVPADEKGRVRLTRLARLAVERLRLLPGEVRLVGWTDEALPGVEIRPAAPQNSTYTLVLAHLERGELPKVKADTNVAEDYLDPAFDFEPEMLEGDDPLRPIDATDPLTGGQ